MDWNNTSRELPASLVTLDFPTPDAAEFIGGLGADAVAIDLEHFSASGSDLSNFARACELAGVDPVARTRGREEAILTCLDAGISTIELTEVHDVSEVDEVIGWSSFAPLGSRGIGRNRASSFGHHTDGYPAFVEANLRDGINLLVHIETVAAASSIREIASRPSVKALIVGAHDLAASAGRPGHPEHPDIQRMVEAAISDVLDSDAKLGMSASDLRGASRALNRGASLVLVSQARLISQSLLPVTQVVRKANQ